MPSKSALEIVSESAPAATWDHARELFGRVLPTVGDWLELGAVLTALREQFFAQGGSGRFGSPHAAANRAPDVSGWQAKVREELDISDDTARRYLEKAHYVALLDNARRLKPVTYLRDGEPITVKPTPEMAKLAAGALNEVLAGTQKPAFAWAGVCGEGLRVAKTGKKERAAINHGRNIARALTALQRSLPRWTELKPEERAALERGWELVRPLLPPTFR